MPPPALIAPFSSLFPTPPRPGKASRWFGVSQSKSAKTTANILQQEELIAQKKREIEARLEQQERQNSLRIRQLPLFGECVRGAGRPGVAQNGTKCVSDKRGGDGSAKVLCWEPSTEEAEAGN